MLPAWKYMYDMRGLNDLNLPDGGCGLLLAFGRIGLGGLIVDNSRVWILWFMG